jgi:xanthine dehydrogenase accessory factor
MKIMNKVAELNRENRSFVLATIIESKGSTPRHIGKMIVYSDGQIEGTVGGGPVELQVIKDSIKALGLGQSRIGDYILNPLAKGGLNMHCGGSLKVFIEVFNSKPELILVGGGHVAHGLATMADLLGYPYKVVDDRPDYCTENRFPNAKGLCVHEDLRSAIRMAQIDSQSYVAIFTKDADDIALEEVLKSSAAYVGMIGSRKKIKRIFDKLLGLGVDEDMLNSVHTPIGLDIGAETPEEIAVSIMGEIIKKSK